METSIGPNEGNSSSKDESSLPSSIPSVRKFKETPIGGPVTEEIISPQKSKPPPSRNPSQKSIRPTPSEFIKQQSTERLKPSAIGPQHNKCKDKVIDGLWARATGQICGP